jgi:hypothetical protein
VLRTEVGLVVDGGAWWRGGVSKVETLDGAWRRD